MKILGYTIEKQAQNATNTPPTGDKKRKRFSGEVNEPRPDRTKMQMDELRDAVESALDPQNPRYSDLYGFYEQTIKDSEVITQITNATDKLEAEPFAITVDGDDNDDLTKLFKKSWFTDLLWCLFEYDMWGYTVAEAGQFADNGTFKNFSVFPHKNIHPKRRKILVNEYDQRGIPFAENATEFFLIELGQPKDIGLLEVLTKCVIWKSFSEADWSRYNEKVGIPSLIVGTDADGKELTKIENAAKNFGGNQYMVGDIDVNSVKLLEASGAGSTYNTFEKHIDRMEKQIAKIINGQTATTESQAWAGSANVQKQTYADKHSSRLRRYSNIINDQVLPFLRYHGYPLPEGAEFRFKVLDDEDATQIEDTENEPNNDPKPEPTNPQNRLAKKKGSRTLVAATDEELLKKIFEGTADVVDKKAWLNTFETLLNQVQKGLGIDLSKVDVNSEIYKLFIDLQADTARFAAFRQYQQQTQMASLITDGMSLDKFKLEAKPVLNMFREYAKTEKQSAFAQAAAAERWQGFAENADIYPNLEWRTAGDSDVRDDHRKLDGLILPISDPFWNSHTPPLGWGCRCEVIQTDAPVKEKEGFKKTTAPKGFDGNPGKDRKLFSDTAGYYTNTSTTDSKEVNNLTKQYLTDYLKP